MSAYIPAKPEMALYGPLIGRLGKALSRKGYLFTTAESCTGGLIAAACTDMPGSSAWFAGGVVAYADAVKREVLNVPQGLLRDFGAVSEPVVRRMALGALAACGAQAAVAVSGIAGPDGGTPEKPVGTVWIAFALAEQPRTSGECFPDTSTHKQSDDRALSITLLAERYEFPGNRAEVRLAAMEAAFKGIVRILEVE